MPSPFPGMDPYLEDPGLWPDVHHELISVARQILNGRLAPKYLARIEERVYIGDAGNADRKQIIPDVGITVWPGRENRPAAAGTAMLDVVEPVRLRTKLGEEVHEARIEIVDLADRSVVAVIEFVSPSNKIGGSRGRESFERKREEVMDSESHWVEIDLLRNGSSLTARKGLAPHHYLVHISPVGERPDGFVWPIPLAHRLPTIPIPLRSGDPDVLLDLQEVLDVGYARACYDLVIDYRTPPVPPLEGEWAEWADRLLREKSLR